MKRFVVALTALSMLAPAAALAQTRHYDHRPHHTEKRVIIKKKVVKPRHHHWARGHALPHQYRSRVVQYNRYHLSRPAHGRVWVRAGNQFLLINPHTGYIFATATPR